VQEGGNLLRAERVFYMSTTSRVLPSPANVKNRFSQKNCAPGRTRGAPLSCAMRPSTLEDVPSAGRPPGQKLTWELNPAKWWGCWPNGPVDHTFNLVTGQLKPDRGRACSMARMWKDWPFAPQGPARLAIGTLPRNPASFAKLTVRQTCSWPSRKKRGTMPCAGA